MTDFLPGIAATVAQLRAKIRASNPDPTKPGEAAINMAGKRMDWAGEEFDDCAKDGERGRHSAAVVRQLTEAQRALGFAPRTAFVLDLEAELDMVLHRLDAAGTA